MAAIEAQRPGSTVFREGFSPASLIEVDGRLRHPSRQANLGILTREISTYELTPVLVPVEAVMSVARRADSLINHHIHASDPSSKYPRPFGRDSAEVATAKFKTHQLRPTSMLPQRVVPAILRMIPFIAKENIPEAGIQQGKMIHERGTAEEGYPAQEGWYVNEDGVGENYDTADATDEYIVLFSKLTARYPILAAHTIGPIREMLSWAVQNTEEFGGSAFTGADFDPQRTFRGLNLQWWRDNGFSIVDQNGEVMVNHPIYPAREQALRYEALKKGAVAVADVDPVLSSRAQSLAIELKRWFNDVFVYSDNKGAFIADALDGNKRRITTALSADVIATLATDIIDDTDLADEIITRTFDELFDPRGGLRTVAPSSIVHPENVYHGQNSLWTPPQRRAIDALEERARMVEERYPSLSQKYRGLAILTAEAMARPSYYFQTPIETVQIPDSGSIEPYREFNGRGEVTGGSALVQAWTGADTEYGLTYLQAHGVTHITMFAPQAA